MKTFWGRPAVRVAELTTWDLRGEHHPDQGRLTVEEAAVALGIDERLSVWRRPCRPHRTMLANGFFLELRGGTELQRQLLQARGLP